MSRRNKLEKFQELRTMPHVYQNFDFHEPKIEGQGKQVELKGKWNDNHFKRSAPLVLELACGRGEYCLGLSTFAPQKNYIGIDIKGARIWKGATIAAEQKKNHVAFLRSRIELIEHFFAAGEIDEIWIIFPDPFSRKTQTNRRMTAPMFLDIYFKLLKPGGLLHLKTDSQFYFEYSTDTVGSDERFKFVEYHPDIAELRKSRPELDVLTYYEKSHLKDGRTIQYFKAQKEVSKPN